MVIVSGVLAAVFLLGGAVQAQIQVRDDRGREYRAATPPRRIISLVPSMTESVCALGGCDKLVGTDRYSDSPASVVTLPKLGGLDDVQVERVVALQPDVVLASNSTRAVARLESLGMNVVVLESQTHADVKRSLHQIAALLGRPWAAQQVWTQIERGVKEAREKIPASLHGRRVYFEVASAPYAAGEASFIGETLTMLGMGNAVPAKLGPFPKLNPEFVVRLQPDIIMASSNGVDDMPSRPGWSTLRALKERSRCGFDLERYEVLIRPGPRLGEAAGILAQCLSSLEPRP